ncbi:unnamed protein product, partial [Prorocentrum cordatum]
QGLLQRVAQDLSSETKTRDLTPVYMSRTIAWVYRRCNSWDLVAPALLPLIRASAAEFRCGEFARLAQALPEERGMLEQVASLLRAGVDEMGRKDFLLFLVGCVHGELMEETRRPSEEPDSLAFACLKDLPPGRAGQLQARGGAENHLPAEPREEVSAPAGRASCFVERHEGGDARLHPSERVAPHGFSALCRGGPASPMAAAGEQVPSQSNPLLVSVQPHGAWRF